MKRKKQRNRPVIKEPTLDIADAAILAGTLAGAAAGSIAGPPGTLAGTVIGAEVGLAAGMILREDEQRRHTIDEELDATIGVSGGPIGAAVAPEKKSP